MTNQYILSELRENILQVTISREKKLNALNREILAALAAVIDAAGKNPEVRAVLLTGAGEKAFVAGADIAEFSAYTRDEGEDLARNGQELVFNAIENSGKVFLAAINGFALGGGLELAMACHIRIAADHARLGLPEVGLGLIPGYGGTQRLTRLVGKGKAIELIAAGEIITAGEALEIGLVNHVVPLARLIERSAALLGKITQRAPLAVAGALRAVNASASGLANGFEVEIEEFGKCFDTADFKEGVTAFLEKRTAKFTGI